MRESATLLCKFCSHFHWVQSSNLILSGLQTAFRGLETRITLVLTEFVEWCGTARPLLPVMWTTRSATSGTARGASCLAQAALWFDHRCRRACIADMFNPALVIPSGNYEGRDPIRCQLPNGIYLSPWLYFGNFTPGAMVSDGQNKGHWWTVAWA